MRQIVLDTETTGLETSQDHRIIEIGCVELQDRKLTGRNYHQFINPEREIDAGAIEVHGISNEDLADKPVFQHIAQEFVDYIKGAELIIHNAPFDVGFLNHEFRKLGAADRTVEQHCKVLDTLALARSLYPGQRNSLDALCKRLGVDNSQRTFHGALLDAEILADVYLLITGGQVDLAFEVEGGETHSEAGGSAIQRLDTRRRPLPVVTASKEELRRHYHRLEAIDQVSGGGCIWRESGADS